LTQTRTPPQRKDARRNYELLVAAADDEFAASGVNASLERIAKAAGLAVGTLYSHFPTRDHLIAALIAGRMAQIVTLADELAAATRPDQALREWLAAFAHGAATYHGLPESVIRTLNEQGSPLTDPCAQMSDTCARLLRAARGADRRPREIEAPDLLAMTAALAGAAKGAGKPADAYLDVLVDGLLNT
jgi:AcrR family transcriptional regulator